MPQQERVNIAVFIDFDNIEIGVRTTLGEHFDIGTVLEALKERGEVVTKIAYADWTRAGEYSRALTQHAIRLVQRNLTPGGDKNGADINLALDALEMAFTHPHINAYVIVGGDSDFLSLVEKLKQYDKKIFVVGGRAFTSVILQRNCHEFIAYENLAGVRKQSVKEGRPMAPPASLPIAQAFPIVRRALKILADREVSPQTGLLKSTLLQLDSTFSERNYGASSFLDFVEKLSQAGVVSLKHAGRSVMVELNASAFEDGDASAQAFKPRPADETQAAHPTEESQAAQTDGEPQGAEPMVTSEPVRATESAEAGVARATAIIGAATGARWPMYLRNVKQILRQAEGGFDERRYGFGGLMDLLKALQRDGVVRIERDRRGGLRVFQGQDLVKRAQSLVPDNIGNVAPAHERRMADESEIDPMDEQQPPQLLAQPEPVEIDLPDDGPIPMVVDPTAELLGRAKHRKARTTPAAKRAVAPKAAVKKAAPKRSRKKAASQTEPDKD